MRFTLLWKRGVHYADAQDGFTPLLLLLARLSLEVLWGRSRMRRYGTDVMGLGLLG
jgi:hypothetical protein